MLSPDTQPIIALGVLSSAITYETGRTVANKCRQRRNNIRLASRRFPDVLDKTVVMRFLLSANYSHRASARTQAANAALMVEAHKEADTEKDVVFLPMTESFHLCAWKKLLWYKHALVAWPTAQYFGIADDDAYVQLAHLAADLRTLKPSSPYVLYGLILWKSYYNKVTLEPATAHSGWGYTDYAAASLREKLERCQRHLLNKTSITTTVAATTTPGRRLGRRDKKKLNAASANKNNKPLPKGPCARMERKLIGVLERDELDPTPPYPFASGPLFAVSRALGSLLTTDGFTQSWLDALEATPVLQFYKQRGRVPFVLRKDACFPTGAQPP